MNISRLKKLVLILRLSLCNDGEKKAEIVKKNLHFGMYGENNYWYPRIIPSEPELVKIHNNVAVATNVYFCTHDPLHKTFSRDQSRGCGKIFKPYYGDIEIFDNCFIGANSTIMYNTKIGPNSIVAAGSVVTKDIPSGEVWGGVPARKIGMYTDLMDRREKK